MATVYDHLAVFDALDERLGPDDAMKRAEMLMGALLGVNIDNSADAPHEEQLWWMPNSVDADGEIPVCYHVAGYMKVPRTMREGIQELANLLRERANQLTSLIVVGLEEGEAARVKKLSA